MTNFVGTCRTFKVIYCLNDGHFEQNVQELITSLNLKSAGRDNEFAFDQKLRNFIWEKTSFSILKNMQYMQMDNHYISLCRTQQILGERQAALIRGWFLVVSLLADVVVRCAMSEGHGATFTG